MRNTAAKRRAGQEDVDSDCLFDNFLQLRAFRSTPRPRNPSPLPAELPCRERRECDYRASLNVVIMPNTAQKLVPNNSQSDSLFFYFANHLAELFALYLAYSASESPP